MPRTSKADANYFSISNGTYQWYAGTDQAKPAEYAPAPFVLLPDSPQSWDAIAKVCDGTHGVHLNEVRIAQGRENSVDLNVSVRDMSIVGDFGAGGGVGDQVLTVKGGCSRIVLHGVCHSSGRNADVVIGAWSDQCFDPSTDLDFRYLSHADGRPLTFILSRCSRVKLPEGAKVLRWRSIGYSLYWWAKWLAVKVGLFGIY